jgi:hypothetical protein
MPKNTKYHGNQWSDEKGTIGFDIIKTAQFKVIYKKRH